MNYKIDFPPEAGEEIRHLSPEVKMLIRAALRELSRNPHTGQPLKEEFEGLWKYRARHYRIIYEIHSGRKGLVVVWIDERETVYDRLRKLLRG